ncbi:MAG: protein kinase [Gemmataceae bacterium]
MSCDKRPGAEPIRGYRLIEPLGRGGYGEVWKCEAPGGIHKAIKFVYGNLGSLDGASRQAEDELHAVQRIKSIRHPFLLSMDRVECVSGELVIVTELADHNLHDLLQKYRQNGLIGVPRAELLDYLREAAEVLDLLNLKFDLQHLDVKPRNLFVVSDHVKVADFGLVSSLSGASSPHPQPLSHKGRGEIGPGQHKVRLGAITPLYAAPELFHGTLSRQADQYSLAIAFQELLTGVLPFQGKNPRQLLLQHTQEEPDLDAVPAEDRPILARALAKNPDHRFLSCMDLIRALRHEATPRIQAEPAVPPGAAATSTADTGTGALDQTPAPRPKRVPTLAPDVLPGYHFVESLGATPQQELWKIEAPDKSQRLLKLVYGFHLPDEEALKATVARWRSIQHPGIVAHEVAQIEPGRLALVADLPRETLRDRFQECVHQKLPGIRRGELVDYVRAAAEVLDYLYQQHGVQHLVLGPRQILLDNGWVQINDFGLAQIVWQTGGNNLAHIQSRYAAPELFTRQISPACDQYSLAVLYAEMLTGVYPFKGAQPAQRGAPNLEGLTEEDRAVVRRALSADPAQRWPSCLDMVMALEGTQAEEEEALRAKPDHFARMIQKAKPSQQAVNAGSSKVDLHRVVAQLISSLGGEEAARDLQDVPELSSAGDRLTYSFQVGLPIGSARRKLQAFPGQWQGKLTRNDEHDLAFQIALPASFWDQMWGRQAGVDVAIHIERVHPLSPTPLEVRLTIDAFKTNPKRSAQLIEDIGPGVIDALRTALMVNAEKRTQERFLWPHPVTVIPLDPDGRRQEPIACRGKDISPGGMGLYFPHDVNTIDVLLELPNLEDGATVEVPGALVRAKCCADGWYDVGVLFRLPCLRRSHAEIRVPVHA